ncbi:hypothetical protein Tco_1055306 [Tanacetum coccineum]|uniref:Uncharacterized protein n=1 Tax=Tanacetum coccineum TaxID=301880 RepID=A0ABQ5GZL2_9ASTR
MSSETKLTRDEDGEPFNDTKYRCLTSWFSKKQTALATSTTEAKYVSTGKAYQQALWMKQALVDYDINLDDIPVLCDNKSGRLAGLKKSRPYTSLREQTIEDREARERDHYPYSLGQFNTIITSLKALNESFLSRNHVRKFLKALPFKWRLMVTAIEESKDLSKLSLDELVGNLKVYEVVLEKDLESAKNKKEKNMQWPSRISRNSLEEEASLSDNPMTTKRTFEKSRKREGKIEDASSVVIQITSLVIALKTLPVIKRHSLLEVGAIVEMIKERKIVSCSLNEYYPIILLNSSSLDNESRENEYDKLGQISLRIINKNKHLKAKNESLKKTINELKTKLDTLEKGKETSSNCDACNELRLEVNSLKLKLASFENSSSSLQKMVEMQKPSKDKCGLGYTETIASSRNTKIKNLGDQLKKKKVVGG